MSVPSLRAAINRKCRECGAAGARRDGTETFLSVWFIRFAEYGEIFTMRTPLRGKLFGLRRRCKAHKKSGMRA